MRRVADGVNKVPKRSQTIYLRAPTRLWNPKLAKTIFNVLDYCNKTSAYGSDNTQLCKQARKQAFNLMANTRVMWEIEFNDPKLHKYALKTSVSLAEKDPAFAVVNHPGNPRRNFHEMNPQIAAQERLGYSPGKLLLPNTNERVRHGADLISQDGQHYVQASVIGVHPKYTGTTLGYLESRLLSKMSHPHRFTKEFQIVTNDAWLKYLHAEELLKRKREQLDATLYLSSVNQTHDSSLFQASNSGLILPESGLIDIPGGAIITNFYDKMQEMSLSTQTIDTRRDQVRLRFDNANRVNQVSYYDLSSNSTDVKDNFTESKVDNLTGKNSIKDKI